MRWSNRGTGRDYDSLNGHTLFDHDCKLNFSGSAKAMEGFTANKLVNESSILNSKNVEVVALVGGDESSAISSCCQNSSHSIGKLSDQNHASMGVENEN